MSVQSNDGMATSDDRTLELFHNTRGNPRAVRCIKSDPPMVGFGRKLKRGDIVTIDGTVHHEIGFAISVPSECAFYAYDYFEPTDEFFNE